MSFKVFHRDIGALVDFYVGARGFQTPEADMSADHVVVSRDSVRIGCCRHDLADPSPRRPPDGCEIVRRVDDIQAEYDRVLSSLFDESLISSPAPAALPGTAGPCSGRRW